MDIRIWKGSVDGTFTTDGNWLGGVAPVATNFLIFPKWATQNVDGSDQSATDFGGYMTEFGGTLNLGSDETPLKLGLETGARVDLRGSGEYHVLHNGTGTITVVIEAWGVVELGSITGDLATTIDIIAGTGEVGIGRNKGDVAEVPTIRMSTQASLWIGEGVTTIDGAADIVTVTITKGSAVIHSGVATLTVGEDAVVDMYKAISTKLNLHPGGLLNKYGTDTYANISQGGKMDCDVDTWAFTITDWDIYGLAAHVIDTEDRITATDGMQLASDIRMSDVTLELGKGKKISLA